MPPTKLRIALCAALAALTIIPAIADDKADALIKQVQTATKSAKSLTARISISQIGGGRDMKASGTVKLKKPNMAIVEIGAPFGTTVASDGKDLIMYMKDQNMYQKKAADPKGANIEAVVAVQVPLFFTAGSSDSVGIRGISLAKSSYAGTQKRGGVQYRVLQLTRGASADQKFRFYVAPSNLITGMTYEGGQGAGSIKLSCFLEDVRLNANIPAAAFAYKLPQTAKLYEEPNFESKLLKVGAEAPPFELTNPADKTRFSLAKTLDGRKAVLVNFWFYNWGACREEFPHLQKIYTELKGKGLDLIAVNGMDDEATINKYIKENNFTFRVGMADKKAGGIYDVADKYGVQAYPTNYLVAPDGKVLWRSVGFDEDGLRKALKDAGLQ